MEKIGILIETKDGEIKKANYGVITAARNSESELYALLLEGSGADYKASLQAYGIHKIIEISSNQGALIWNPVSWSRAIVNAMEHFNINTLLGLASFLGKDLLPRVAAGLDAPLVLDCSAVNLAEHTVVKSQYSGKTISTLKTDGAFHIYGIRPNAIEATTAPCEANVVPFKTTEENLGLTVKETKPSASKGIDLSEADLILSGDEAWKIQKISAFFLNVQKQSVRLSVRPEWPWMQDGCRMPCRSVKPVKPLVLKFILPAVSPDRCNILPA